MSPQLSRSHYSTVVPPHSVDLNDMKLSDKPLQSAERANFITEYGELSQQIKTIHLPTLKKIADFSECKSFSQEMGVFITTYDHKIREYGVIQKSYRFLYTNISHRARESHNDLCMLIDWIQSDQYTGLNMIGRKYEDNLINRQEISRYFKQRDSSFDVLPDDLKTLIFHMKENSEKMYGYNNDLLSILRTRVPKVFNTNLCIKVLQNELKPVLGKCNTELNNYVDYLCDYLKYFDKEYKDDQGYKKLPYGDRNFEYYDHLWYGISKTLRPHGVAIKLTPEELVAEKTLRNVRKNIDIRHEQEDIQSFIPAPYIIDRSKE